MVDDTILFNIVTVTSDVNIETCCYRDPAVGNDIQSSPHSTRFKSCCWRSTSHSASFRLIVITFWLSRSSWLAFTQVLP